MDHAYAEVNGIRLHYVTVGHGPLMLFVHASRKFWYEWRRQLREFGRDHQAVAPDIAATTSRASRPSFPSTGSLMVEDLRALASHLGHETFVLVGHDWGGVVAWAFAIAHPTLLERLVIVNAPHPRSATARSARTRRSRTPVRYMLTFRSASRVDPGRRQLRAAARGPEP